ncbi:MAG TPA: sigma-70 family RNA polymerase sigma factor [Blastocatellia bacterium]|nr:sigma-70 family RNA polymerase sigma factor [Blastocatellia bacterium]
MKHIGATKASENLNERDDRALVVACLEGDHAAWEALIRRYQRLIYSIPIKARLSQEDAADIFQSVCLKLYEKLNTIRDGERVSSWLITTTSRECWRISARNRREAIPSGSDDENGSNFIEIPATGLLADEEREVLERQHQLRHAVEALPDRCRELISMLFYHENELSYVDIAGRMKMPVPSIGPTRARCLEKLRKLLAGKL